MCPQLGLGLGVGLLTAQERTLLPRDREPEGRERDERVSIIYGWISLTSWPGPYNPSIQYTVF